jgi:putative nucleotidyltransferase with HDIG domain
MTAFQQLVDTIRDMWDLTKMEAFASSVWELVPELHKLWKMHQGHVHQYDGWTHSKFTAAFACSHSDPILMVAALLHDVGKPAVQEPRRDGDGFKFHDHDDKGAEMALEILGRLECPEEMVGRIVKLIKWHTWPVRVCVDPKVKESTLLGRANDMGEDLDRLFCLAKADLMALRDSLQIAEFKRKQENPDIALDGAALIAELKLPPGPIIGHVLKGLKTAVAKAEVANEPAKLLELAQKLAAEWPTSQVVAPAA